MLTADCSFLPPMFCWYNTEICYSSNPSVLLSEDDFLHLAMAVILGTPPSHKLL